MKKYYIIRDDGTSLFQLPYPEDFCYHCLSLLIEDGQKYRLCSIDQDTLSLFADSNLIPKVVISFLGRGTQK